MNYYQARITQRVGNETAVSERYLEPSAVARMGEFVRARVSDFDETSPELFGHVCQVIWDYSKRTVVIRLCGRQ